ncbi:flavin reductase family protein [Streptomyces sp. NBC_01288]|uniref:flavin reductase family protein n=1 Tax=Streptomyces sp. NBC_01288 TaxID=2903814 RepID=UPI002E10DC35|nr:flavin reductase family protein [Streptomyces sp. NBC_01288]
MAERRPRLRAVTDERDLRTVLGGFPSGVVAVCALRDGAPAGMAVSSFTSVSLEPALVSVCVSVTSRTWAELRESPAVGISVLAEGDGGICRDLAGPAAERFGRVEWAPVDSGAVLLPGGVAWLECVVADEILAGDHLVVLLEVRAVADYQGERPLVFHRSRFRALAG